MIDDGRDGPIQKSISLRELAAMLPPMPEDDVGEETVREWDRRMEAWYAKMHRDIVVVPFALACEGVPEGWLDVISQTKRRIMNTIGDDPARQRAFEKLTVWATDEELGFGFGHQNAKDPMLAAICGRATRRSRCVCAECGRRARRRELAEHYIGTLCSRCVARPLLRQQIAALRQSLPNLRALGQPIEQGQVPEFLRPSFRQACDGGESDLNGASLPIERFETWAREWLLIEVQLRVDDE